MVFTTSKYSTLSSVVLAVTAVLLWAPSPVLADDEPIAYVGHGALFDSKGNEITPTPEFVAKAQEWYRQKLLSGLNAAKKNEFAAFERRLNADVRAEGQARLLVQQRFLDWLIANSPQAKSDSRMMGKLNALNYALKWNLPERPDVDQPRTREEFKINPELENKLKQMNFNAGNITVLSATVNLGQAYINECMAAGVPIPPPIGRMDPAGVNGWKSQGFIPTGTQFIVRTPAEVRTFQSSSPPGMCIALPRYSDASLSTVSLDGVICLGQTSSKVCFWDNQMPNPSTGIVQSFPFASGTQIPIGLTDLTINPAGLYQAGGFEIAPGAGGICTDCHAGQNPYIVHPLADLGGGLLMGDLGSPPLNLPMFSASRYDPLVAAAWPQNALSHSPTLVPAVCRGCHRSGGPGGAFPHLSSELSGGFCNTILAQAIDNTMPPGAAGSQKNNPDVIAFRDWCNSAATSGPSNRGDPHLTTTNGINYDFQAAGEFVALRNSTTQFELQTRQTPVSTTFMPGANAYTGLASCVSLNTAAALRVGKHRITYQPPPGQATRVERLQLRIDGTLATLPAKGIDLGNGNTIAKAAAGEGIDIKAADGTRVIITSNFWSSQGYWYLNVEVLNTPAREGTMGEILLGNWLPLNPNGSSFGPAPTSLTDRYILLNQKFADAWRVKNITSLFDYAAGTSTAMFTDRNWPPESGQPCKATTPPSRPAKPIERQVAQRLCRAIKDKAVFENCVLDLTAMGNTNVVQAYQRSLQLRANALP